VFTLLNDSAHFEVPGSLLSEAQNVATALHAVRANDSGHLPRRKVGGDDDEVSKGASTKQRPVVTANAARFIPQKTMDPSKLVDGRLRRGSDQGVDERDQ